MGFYEQLSNYYDVVFPPQPAQIEFLTGEFQQAGRGKKILDVACANGGYSLALAAKGFQVVGFDLEEKMIDLAREKKAVLEQDAGRKVEAEFFRGDMREADLFGRDFHGLFCIGNSLVHLTGEQDLMKAVNGFCQALVNGGVAIVQVVNYDRIIKYGVDSLPNMDGEKVRLIRNYLHLENGLIDFQTVLTVKENGHEKQYFNSVNLKPLLKNDLFELFDEAGFNNITIYGGFNRDKHTDDSPATVLIAKK